MIIAKLKIIHNKMENVIMMEIANMDILAQNIIIAKRIHMEMNIKNHLIKKKNIQQRMEMNIMNHLIKKKNIQQLMEMNTKNHLMVWFIKKKLMIMIISHLLMI